MVILASMDDMAEACANGEAPMFTCNPASYVYVPLVGVLFAPIGFMIGLSSEDVEANICGARAWRD